MKLEVFLSFQLKLAPIHILERQKQIWRGNWRGNYVYVNENVPCRTINADNYLKYFEVVLLEFSFRNIKWLCFGSYKPPHQNK